VLKKYEDIGGKGRSAAAYQAAWRGPCAVAKPASDRMKTHKIQTHRFTPTTENRVLPDELVITAAHGKSIIGCVFFHLHLFFPLLARHKQKSEDVRFVVLAPLHSSLLLIGRVGLIMIVCDVFTISIGVEMRHPSQGRKSS
jgi:hypothetical protein